MLFKQLPPLHSWDFEEVYDTWKNFPRETPYIHIKQNSDINCDYYVKDVNCLKYFWIENPSNDIKGEIGQGFHTQ